MDQATRLRQLMNEHKKEPKTIKNLRIITIASGKGGVGKTNFVANLAIELQRLGNKIIILDADFGFANIDVILNIVAKHSFIDIITKKKTIMDVLSDGPEGVKVISGVYDVYKLSEISDDSYDHLIESFELLSQIADTLIIDTGAGLQQTALNFMNISNDIIILTTPEPTAITDAYSVIKALAVNNISHSNIYTVLNMVDNDKEADMVIKRLNTATSQFLKFELENLGYIPFDKHIRSSVKLQLPVTLSSPKSKSAVAINQIANKLTNDSRPTQEKSIRSIVKSILGFNTFLGGNNAK